MKGQMIMRYDDPDISILSAGTPAKNKGIRVAFITLLLDLVVMSLYMLTTDNSSPLALVAVMACSTALIASATLAIIKAKDEKARKKAVKKGGNYLVWRDIDDETKEYFEKLDGSLYFWVAAILTIIIELWIGLDTEFKPRPLGWGLAINIALIWVPCLYFAMKDRWWKKIDNTAVMTTVNIDHFESDHLSSHRNVRYRGVFYVKDEKFLLPYEFISKRVTSVDMVHYKGRFRVVDPYAKNNKK